MNHDNVNHVNLIINPMNNFLSANECVICLESTFPLSHNIIVHANITIMKLA
jgi:hypothetical protein